MEFIFSAQEAIKARCSVRTYEAKALSGADKEKILTFSKSLGNPFDAEVSFRLLNVDGGFDAKELGTYGVIKGTKEFIGATVPKGEFALEAFGYTFENMILYATSLGLGTCWIAGTFNHSGFQKAMQVKENELFPAVSAIGYSAEKKRLTEALFQKVLKARQRKPWSDLFFKDNFDTPLSEGDAGEYALPLEMLRQAPSASNKQPWRVVQAGSAYHFYEEKTPGYQKEGMLDIQRVDLGIALCHFHLTATENNLLGEFTVLAPKEITPPANTEYIISWVMA